MATEAVATPARIIPRPRLTALLDENPARIKLLVAPAGYGKTTLAQQWLGVPERRDGWYRGGPASADVAALAAGIAIAVAEIVPDAGERMRQRIRATGQPEEDVDVLAELLAEDVQEWPADAWLAIDDYQFAMEAAASERFVELLTQETPVQVVITSRSRPSWATARRILYGEIQEIERQQLAMEHDEAKTVIGRDDENVRALLARAQGWPAVIQLARSATQVDLPRQALPPSLYEYFAEELYQRLDPQLQAALCKICIAPTITSGVQEVLFGQNADELVSTAVRLGILQEQDEAYEIHPLLRGFLEPKLVLLGRDEIDQLATEVVDHFISIGSWDDAYNVIVRFEVPARLEQLVSSGLDEIIESGRLSTLSQWLASAARYHVTSPILDFAEAELAFRQGRYGTALALASNATHGAATYETSLRTRILLRAGQSALLDSHGRAALEHFRAARAIAPSGPLERESLLGEFFALIELRLRDAEDVLSRLDRVSTRGPEDIIRMRSARILYADRSGGLLEALAEARDVYPLLERITDPVIKTSFLNCYGHSLGVTSHYEEALRSADDLASTANEYRLEFVLPHAATLRALAAIGLRDIPSALSALADAERSSDDPHFDASTAILRARVALLRGDPEESVAILRSPLIRQPTDAMHAEYLGCRALAEVATGAFDLAAETTNQVLRAPEYARGGTTTAMLVKAVLTLHEDLDHFRSLIGPALAFVFQGGRLDELVAVYRAFPPVLGEALSSAEYGTAAAALAGRANDGRVARQVGFTLGTPLAGSLGNLTRREREVLVLIARGLTNKAIASELVISESTVKVHVRHLLEKMGAATRTEAAARVGGVLESGD